MLFAIDEFNNVEWGESYKNEYAYYGILMKIQV